MTFEELYKTLVQQSVKGKEGPLPPHDDHQLDCSCCIRKNILLLSIRKLVSSANMRMHVKKAVFLMLS